MYFLNYFFDLAAQFLVKHKEGAQTIELLLRCMSYVIEM